MKKENKLAGFTDEELHTELNKRLVNKEMLEYKTINNNGFTTKDVVCIEGCQYDWEEEQRGYKDKYGPHYYFYLKIDGKLFDIYYSNCVTDKPNGNADNCDPSNWPKETEDGCMGSLTLVPPGFAEASENCYEYHGEKGKVKEHLAKHGVTDFRIWNPRLKDPKTEYDRNYKA